MRTGALAVVIGRAGSRGLPGKNSRLLAGRPMICHTLDDVLGAESVDRVVVSTDGDAIAAAAEAMSVEVIRRPATLACDTTPVVAAVRHAVGAARSDHDVIVILYANVPLRPAGLIDRAVQRLHQSSADSVQSYCNVGKHHPDWMVRLAGDGRVTPYNERGGDRRQDLPPLHLPDGGVIAVTRRSLESSSDDDPHGFLGIDRRGVETEPGAVVDVDGPDDLALAETMLARRAAEVMS